MDLPPQMRDQGGIFPPKTAKERISPPQKPFANAMNEQFPCKIVEKCVFLVDGMDYQWIIVDYQRNSMDYQWIIIDSGGLSEESNGLSMDYHRILLIIRGIQWITNGLSLDSLDYQRNSMDYQWIITGFS